MIRSRSAAHPLSARLAPPPPSPSPRRSARRARLRPALVAAGAVLASIPTTGAGQEYGLVLGLGRTSWSGAAADGRWSPARAITGGSLTGEWGLGSSLGGRLELGGRHRVADLGDTGLFAQPTSVVFDRAQVTALLRPSTPVGSGSTRLYGEVGVGAWVRSLCDVDLEGGPGFLGGETVGCRDWITEEGLGPILPRHTGGALVVGAGARRGAWGVGLRVELEQAGLLETPSGPVKPVTVEVAGQWVFAGVGRGTRAPDPPEEEQPTAPERGEGTGGVPHARGGASALVAGVLEASVPMAGYLYAGDARAGVLPNVVRVGAPVVAIVGWAEDEASLVVGGILMYCVGTVWAVTGAARHAHWRDSR